MPEKKPKIPLTGVVKIPDSIAREIDMEASRLGVFKYEVVLAAWRAYRAKGKPIPESVTIFRPQGTVSACDDPYTEVKSALSGPSMPAETEPENIDPEVTSWLAMLQYILVHGEKKTKDAITSNLERFHLLTRILKQEVVSHERGGEVPEPSPDQQARMDRVRELGKRYSGSGADPISDEDTPRRDVPPDSHGIGKRRKH